MIYDILEKVINKNRPPTASVNQGASVFDKLLNSQDERISALQEELNKKNEELEELRNENKKLVETSTPQPTQIENQKPLSAQEVYRKFQTGKAGDIIATLETEFKK